MERFAWNAYPLSPEERHLRDEGGQNRESDLSHYELYRGKTPEFVAGPDTFVARVEPGPYATVPYEDKGLEAHSAYYYRVVALDRDGNRSEPSDVCKGIAREPLEER